MNRPSFLAVPAIVAIALSSCSPAAETPERKNAATVEDTNDTLASVLNGMENTETISEAVEEVGLVSLMDGSGAYTLLAPMDAAFESLGERGERLMEDDQRPLLAGLLRAHILPGLVTPEEIGAAIDGKGGSVEMTTLGGGTVTFSRADGVDENDNDDRTIIVSDRQGSSARISGTAVAASNGAVIPIDTVLATGASPTAPAQ